MKEVEQKPETARKAAPRRARGQRTYEKLLSAAQEVLLSEGYNGLNSNAIVERAGMTPPAFYRYFENKFAVLDVLSRQLMEAQNELIKDETDFEPSSRASVIARNRRVLDRTIEITQDFPAGAILMHLMRALPELQDIRTQSHIAMSEFVANELLSPADTAERNAFFTRARLGIEIGHATIEMLFETGFRNRKIVLERAATAIAAIYDDVLPYADD